jgi:hypothetical protein
MRLSTNNSLLTIVCTLLISSVTAANCDSNSISVSRHTGFGLSFGGGNSSATSEDEAQVNLPVQINGRWGCFKQKSSLSIKGKNDKDRSAGVITISPIQAEAEDIPNFNTSAWLIVDQTESDFSFSVLNVVCAGEKVLSSESFSGSFKDVLIRQQQDINFSTRTVFATGIAAQNLQRNSMNSVIPEAFSRKIETFSDLNSNGTSDQATVPSLYMSSEGSSNIMEKRTEFRSGKRISKEILCQENFRSQMNEYSLEKLADQNYRGQYILKFSIR